MRTMIAARRLCRSKARRFRDETRLVVTAYSPAYQLVSILPRMRIAHGRMWHRLRAG